MENEAVMAKPISAGSQNTLSIWRAPELSGRWWPVFLRNLLVWRKLAIPSLVGNIAEPLMWLVAFGYGMGALVGAGEGGWRGDPAKGALHPVSGQWQHLHERHERSQL
jgi:lipooligosaccharide transport system permease protein